MVFVTSKLPLKMIILRNELLGNKFQTSGGMIWLRFSFQKGLNVEGLVQLVGLLTNGWLMRASISLVGYSVVGFLTEWTIR